MRRLVIAACAFLGACGPAGAVELLLSSDRSTFDGRTERAIVSVEALDASGTPGVGVVELTAGVGQFVEGTQLALVDGKASATFRCDPSTEAACAGSVRLGASWKGEARSLTIRVTPNDPRVRPLWRVVPTLVPVTLHAAALAPDQTVWAVGDRGTVLSYRVTSGWGTPLTTNVTQTLRAVAIDADGTLTAVGDDGVILTGVPPALQRLAHGVTDTLTSVVRHDGALTVGTVAGGVGVWNGADFEVAALATSPINALAVHDGALIAAGNEGIHSCVSLSCVPLTPPILAKWITLQRDADGLWLLGKRMTTAEQPVLVQGPGPDWKSAALPAGDVKAMAWGSNTSDRYVTTSTTVFRQQVGAGWEDLEAPAGGNAVVLLGGTSVLVIGPPGVSLLRVR